MKLKSLLAMSALAALAMSGCEEGGDDSDPYSDGPVLITDAKASCDATASIWDDLFIFEVETVAGVDSVEIDVYVGSSWTGTVRLGERGSGNWYGEEDADDLDSDCDDFRSMYFDVIAWSGADVDYAYINP